MGAAPRHPARRVPRGVLAGARRAAGRERVGRARRRVAAAPLAAPGGTAGGGPGALRRLRARGAGCGRRGGAGRKWPGHRRDARGARADCGVRWPRLGSTWGPRCSKSPCRRLPPGCRFRWRMRSCNGPSTRSAGARAFCTSRTRPARWPVRSPPVTCCCRGSGCRPRRPCSRSWRRPPSCRCWRPAPRAAPRCSRRLRPLSRSPRGRRFPPTSWWRARRWCRAATACSRAARGSPKWSPSSRPIAAGRC